MHLPCDAVNEIVQRHFSKIYERIDRYIIHGNTSHQLSTVPLETKVCLKIFFNIKSFIFFKEIKRQLSLHDHFLES
jgi:hypothetical protein